MRNDGANGRLLRRWSWALALAAPLALSDCGAAKPKPGGAVGESSASASKHGYPTAAHLAPSGHVTYLIGGDARGDSGHVLSWAFEQARAVHALGFLFLGDMEWSRKCDDHFAAEETAHLGSIPLFPTLGNHEIRWFGAKFYDAAKQDRIEAEFKARFLKGTGVVLPPEADVGPRKRIFYSLDLDVGGGKKGLHFIALDNVSDRGFGEAQIEWLKKDLATAGKTARWIIVGMHKPFVGTCVGGHSMAEDKEIGTMESERVLRMLAGENDAKRSVNGVFASHAHYFAQFNHDIAGVKIPTWVTGGLGAHLKACKCEGCRSFHHVLQLDVSDEHFEVTVVRWAGPETWGKPGSDDLDEDDSEPVWNMKCAGNAAAPADELAVRK